MKRQRPSVLAPWRTSDPRVNDQIDAAFQAVWTAFPYFEQEEILSPAHGSGPATLPRQAFLHILVNTFCLPKKRIAAYGAPHLANVKRACGLIDARCAASSRFSAWFDVLVVDAQRRFSNSEYFHG